MRCGDVPWVLTWSASTPGGLTVTPVSDPGDARPVIGRIVPVPLSRSPLTALGGALTSLGPVLRVHNGDLWDAIGTAIIRQVIRAGQARLMYRRFCQAHGELVTTPSGEAYLFPRPAVVCDLPAAAFADLGMAFKHRALFAAAQATLIHREQWQRLAPTALVQALQAVPRIGPWTAGAAVADWSGDFAVYPYADLAVRTWASRAAPTTVWPADEPTFAALWRRAGVRQLSALTLLTLAWGGAHAAGSP
jgi:DNA-3-methyladenine glycosylase II